MNEKSPSRSTQRRPLLSKYFSTVSVIVFKKPKFRLVNATISSIQSCSIKSCLIQTWLLTILHRSLGCLCRFFSVEEVRKISELVIELRIGILDETMFISDPSSTDHIRTSNATVPRQPRRIHLLPYTLIIRVRLAQVASSQTTHPS